MLSKEHIGNLKWFLFLICLFDNNLLTAQIENISINRDVLINRFYAGLRSNTKYFVDNDSVITEGNFQFGTQLSLWIVPSKLKVKSFVAFRGANSKELKAFSSYAVQIFPNKSISIQLGVMATPTTELRPNPTTWKSQIETNAEKTIIGGRPGGKIQLKISDEFKLNYGIFSHDTETVHHLKLSYGNYKVSSYIDNGNVFIATRVDVKNFEFVLTHHAIQSSFSSVIPITNSNRIFLDLTLDRSKQFTFGQIGFRRYFNGELLKGLIDLNYNLKSNYISGGLFLHI